MEESVRTCSTEAVPWLVLVQLVPWLRLRAVLDVECDRWRHIRVDAHAEHAWAKAGVQGGAKQRQIVRIRCEASACL